MATQPYLVRFCKKLLVEIGAFLTGQQMITALLLGVGAFLYQYVRGQLTAAALKENAVAVVYPFVWVVCGFGCFYVIKAAVHLHREMVAEVNAYKPAFHGYVPKQPSRLPGILAASMSIGVLALLSYATFIAAFPNIPNPQPFRIPVPQPIPPAPSPAPNPVPTPKPPAASVRIAGYEPRFVVGEPVRVRIGIANDGHDSTYLLIKWRFETLKELDDKDYAFRKRYEEGLWARLLEEIPKDLSNAEYVLFPSGFLSYADVDTNKILLCACPLG